MAHLYEVLSIDSYAVAAEIKVAFHRLAKTYHPDLHDGDVVAEERFKEINHAYGILGNIESRTLYDEACALENIPAGAENLVGEERLPGGVLGVGAVGRIGMAVHGCDGRTTARSLRVSRSAR